MAHDIETELRRWLSAYLDPAVLPPDAVSRAVVEGRRRLRRRRAVAGGGVAVALATATPFAIDWFGVDGGAAGTIASQDTTPLRTSAVTVPTESPTLGTQTPAAETPLRFVTRTADDPFPGLYGLLMGTLVLTGDGCLAVAGDGGQPPEVVMWGHGWTAEWEDGVVVVRNPTGALFARTGERVKLGGGGSSRDDSPDAAFYADQLCGVDGFWSANDEP